MLPKKSWLRKNGLSRISQLMKQNPEKFVHIKQLSKKGRTVDYWVKYAEKLTKKNGGMLPPYSLLRENNLFGLMNVLNVYPEKFSHIKREYKRKKILDKIEQVIIKTKKIADKNEGIIPNISELRRIKEYEVIYAMQKYPHKFIGMKQEYYISKIKKVKIIGE